MKPNAGQLWRLAASICFLGGVLNALALTRYVSPLGGASPPYTNWAGAARILQDAVDAAQPGDVVLVDDGVYAEGGRVTPDSSLWNRVLIDKDITVQSRNGPGTTIIAGCRMPDADPVRCVFITGHVMLIGFTLTNGGTRATGNVPRDTCGGGLYVEGDFESGIYGCVISGNAATGHGGAAHLQDSRAVVRDSMLSGNFSGGGGGGLCAGGGGPTLENLVIARNRTDWGGGGVVLYHADSVVRNLLVAENTALTEGGGLYFDGCSPHLENLTIAGNTAPAGRGGGLEASYSSHPRLQNCIVWGNTAEQIAFNPNWFGMAVTLVCSDVQGGPDAIVTHGLGPVHWLQGNSMDDPLLSADGEYRLPASSPFLKKGEAIGWQPGEFFPSVPAGAGEPETITAELIGPPAEAPVGAGPAPPPGAGASVAASGTSSNWLARIGFSTHPDGDQDVTIFYRDESLWITVEDADLDPRDTNCVVTATLIQPHGEEWVRKTIRLESGGATRFLGEIALDPFEPGEAMVIVSWTGRDRMLCRQSKISLL